MGGKPPENYKEEPPEKLEITTEEWNELSYHQQYYRINEEQKQKIRESASKNRERNKKWIKKKKSNLECQKCGEDRKEALDFHHKNKEEKKKTISRMVQDMHSIEDIENEIEKCEVLCANCHRVLHS